MDSQQSGSLASTDMQGHHCHAAGVNQSMPDGPLLGRGVTQIDQNLFTDFEAGLEKLDRKKRKFQHSTPEKLPKDTVFSDKGVEETNLDYSFYEYIPSEQPKRVKTCHSQKEFQYIPENQPKMTTTYRPQNIPEQVPRYIPTKLKRRSYLTEKFERKANPINDDADDVYHTEYVPSRSDRSSVTPDSDAEYNPIRKKSAGKIFGNKKFSKDLPVETDDSKFLKKPEQVRRYIPTQLALKQSFSDEVHSGDKHSGIEEYDIYHPEYFPNKIERPANYSKCNYKYSLDFTDNNCENTSIGLYNSEYVPDAYRPRSEPDEKVEDLRSTFEKLSLHQQFSSHHNRPAKRILLNSKNLRS